MSTDLTRPHPIQKFFAWLEASPLPSALFYLLLLFIPGIFLQMRAWSGLLPDERMLDPFLIFFFIWLVESMGLSHYITYESKNLLNAYQKQLPYSRDEFSVHLHNFSTLPLWSALLLNLLGILIGYFTAQSFSFGFPGVDRGMPLTFAITYALAFAFSMMSYGLIFRQLRMIRQFFRDTQKINISHLTSIYSFSRYTAIIAIWIFLITYVNAALLFPEVFENPLAASSIYFLIAFSLAIFYLPLRGMNQRLVVEKEKLLENVTSRIEKTFNRIHTADDKQDLSSIGALRSLLAALREEREMIESIPTWPWRPGTITGLLSALFLPTILGLVNRLLAAVLGI